VSETGAPGAIIVPAYNEERRIPPLLPVLGEAARDLGYTVVVACNGCRDRTVAIVRSVPGLEVLEFDWASKPRALNEAERHLGDVFPRLYVDADVRTTTESLRRLMDALRVETPLAVRPYETYLPDGAPWVVRAFYDGRYVMPASKVWLERHIEGHHIYGTNRAGRQRFDVFPEEGQMMEDAFFDRMFDPEQKLAVEGAAVEVPLPQSTSELFRARVRIYQGNWQLTEWLGHHRPDRLFVDAALAPSTTNDSVGLRRLLRGGATFPSWRPTVAVPVLARVVVNRAAKAKAHQMARAGRQASWR
jgi:glycosyltransferase involved in cell wall biosynthesis